LPDLAVRLGRLELKNPVVCGSSEATMTSDALRAAVDAGAAAVVAKSTNESEAARRQLAAAEYLVLDEGWTPLQRHARGRTLSVFNRSGLVAEPFESWAETVAAADAYAHSSARASVGSSSTSAPRTARKRRWVRSSSSVTPRGWRRSCRTFAPRWTWR
jgi:hypothetical protein